VRAAVDAPVEAVRVKLVEQLLLERTGQREELG